MPQARRHQAQSPGSTGGDAKASVHLEGVHLSYSLHSSAPRVIFDGLSASFGPGSFAVMGPSGVGKTSLLRLIAADLAPTQGVISVNGSTASIHQDFQLVEFLTALNNVVLAAELHGQPTDRAEKLLDMVGVAARGHDDVRTLSGGEQQRVAIARALATGARILLADEPTGSLDSRNTRRVVDLLRQLGEEGYCVIVCTHDMAVAKRLGGAGTLTRTSVRQRRGDDGP